MARAVIRYDKDLPEIQDRRPWERPTSHLVKDDDAPTGWREDDSGRRPSELLLVPKIRKAVDDWRDAGYEGASEVTRRLFEYWFEEDHEIAGFDVPFRYYFCQREAIETLVWLVEIAGQRDAKTLIKAYGKVVQRDLASRNFEFQTTMDGKRQIRRYVPELEAEGVQDLPPENLLRFAFKMATGSGKTWAMAMAIVWSRLHKQRVPGSELSTNFLIVAPNVIVYQRLERDFADNRIFHELPLIPPEWKGGFSQKVILRGEAAEPDPSGNLFLTNIHQLYESRDEEWTPENAVQALLGRKPAQDLASSGQRSMLERIKSLNDLVVFNDEAHHVHNEELAWSKSLLAIHESLPQGLSAWLDFSATPKDQNGMYFPWTVVDYPLAQAVEDRIVKAPIVVDHEDKAPEDPDGVTGQNVAEKYGYWLQAAEILPEQVIGRGLRLMTQVSPDRTQTLEVLGTRNLINILRDQLEAEGVGVASTMTNPPPPIIIEPVKERLKYDIAIPITKPSLEHDFRKLSDLNMQSLEPIYDQEDIDERYRNKLTLNFVHGREKSEVHQEDIAGHLRPVQEIIADITNLVADTTGLTNRFAELYPLIRDYVRSRCFGRKIELNDEVPRSYLERLDIREGIAKYLARKIAELTIEPRKIEFENENFRLSYTKPFSWRRNLPPLEAKKTVFNYVATYNDFERRFAEFLDRARDILRFAALGTTEQGNSGTTFRVDYLKASGAIGFYYPDWVAVQKDMEGEEVNWIIETKGRVWEGTEAKDDAMEEWCRRVSEETGAPWEYIRVNQTDFRSGDFATFRELVVTVIGNAMFRERDERGTIMSRKEVRQARDEGRA